MKPTQFQIDAIKFIIETSKDLSHLLNQLGGLEVKGIEHTGVGCIYYYNQEEIIKVSS